MINENYESRIYSTEALIREMWQWLDIFQRVINYTLAKEKAGITSRKCLFNSDSLIGEQILAVNCLAPSYYQHQKNLRRSQKIVSEVYEGELQRL